MSRSALVTGGSGFLGRRLVARLLAQGWRVRVLSRRLPRDLAGLVQGADVVRGELSGVADLRRAVAGMDIVFHAAGETRDRRRLAAVNVTGTGDLIEAAAEEGVRRVVHVSTVGVFGESAEDVVTEDSPCAPRNDYERTKLAGEYLAAEIAARRGLSLTVVRPANIFGDDDPQGRLLSLIRLVASGRFVFIGPSEAMLNYVYVEDVVEACRLLAEREDAGERVYIVSDPCALGEFVTAIAAALGVPLPTRRLPSALAYAAAAGSEVASLLLRRPVGLTWGRLQAVQSRRVYCPDRLRRELPGWPAVGWREGLRRIVAWYRSSGAL